VSLGDGELGELADGDDGFPAEEHANQGLLRRGDLVLLEDAVPEAEGLGLRGARESGGAGERGDDSQPLSADGRRSENERDSESVEREDEKRAAEDAPGGRSEAVAVLPQHPVPAMKPPPSGWLARDEPQRLR